MGALVVLVAAAVQLQAVGGTPRRLGPGSHTACAWGYDTSGCGWGNDGKVLPDQWQTCAGNSACGAGQQQSPIDVTQQSVLLDTGLPPLRADWKTCMGCEFTNNGHTLELHAPNGGSLDIGDLPKRLYANTGGGIFDLLQLHFHWGCTDATGSEHLVDGRQFPLEMHMVHAQRGAAEPKTTPGGLAVLGVMFRIGDADNAALQPLVDAIVNQPKGLPPNTTLSASVDVAALYPFERIGDYLTYPGSLTTPGCYESVNWLIAGTPMTISQRQLSAIRSAEYSQGAPIALNYRPVQALNGRRVYSSSEITLPTLAAANAGPAPKCEWGYAPEPSRRLRQLAAHGAAALPPKDWSQCAGTACGGSRQSPIDVTPSAVNVDHALPALLATWAACKHCRLHNNGHSVQLDYSGAGRLDIGDIPTRLFGRILGTSAYDLLQIHFHWGDTDSTGSEHLIDGQAYPLEMHMVHAEIGTPAPAKVPGSLTVLGVMFKIGAENQALKPILDAVPKVVVFNTSTRLDVDVDVAALYPYDRISEYLTYRGSLTTPGCYESVNWLLPGTPMTISRAQLDILRSVQGHHSGGKPLGANYRPPQPLNGRQVYATSTGVEPILAASTAPAPQPAPQPTESPTGGPPPLPPIQYLQPKCLKQEDLDIILRGQEDHACNLTPLTVLVVVALCVVIAGCAVSYFFFDAVKPVAKGYSGAREAGSRASARDESAALRGTANMHDAPQQSTIIVDGMPVKVGANRT